MAELVDPEKLVSLPKVAHEYGYHPNYLSQLAKEGKLKAWHVGNSWITTRELIETYIRSAPPPGPKSIKTHKRKAFRK